jgi:hypothetical protein
VGRDYLVDRGGRPSFAAAACSRRAGRPFWQGFCEMAGSGDGASGRGLASLPMSLLWGLGRKSSDGDVCGRRFSC